MDAAQLEFGEIEVVDLPTGDRLAEDVDLFELLAETGDGPPIEVADRCRRPASPLR